MIAIARKTPIYRKNPEEFRIKRKIRFFLLRILFGFQILFLISAIFFVGWLMYFDGMEKTKTFFQQESSEFYHNRGLDIKNITVTGNHKVTSDEIRNVIFSSFGEAKANIVNLDLELVSNEIKNNGWIENITIKKKLPNKLHITVIERSPEAIMQNGDEIYLIDGKGNLITDFFDKSYSELPQIIGTKSKEEIMELFRIIKLDKNVYSKIEYAKRVGNRRWDVFFKNGISLKLPEKEVAIAYEKFSQINKKKNLLNKEIQYIDMRIEGQVVVGR